MKTMDSLQHQWDEEIIQILKHLGSLEAEYPPDLWAARRAAFVRQVEEQAQPIVEEEPALPELFLKHLDHLRSTRPEYPGELLAARRASFVKQIEKYNQTEIEEELLPVDQEMIRLFRRIKSVEADYPRSLMAARRAAFQRQILLGDKVSILEVLLASIRSMFPRGTKAFSMPAMNSMRASLVLVVLLVVAFVGSLFMSPVQPGSAPPSSEGEVAQPGPISVNTSTAEIAKVICKPGYLPPLCLAKEFDKSRDLTFQGNGSARPAVAKDTLPGFSGVHKPAYINDGLYGPGASWISNSPYSWIKIDLGKNTTINTVEFGRDRLGNFNDRDPGQFVIAVALNDDIYADGNSSNDYVEYTEIYNSEQAGFDGVVSGAETVQAQFGPVVARYVKIIFANPGTAVDEVEVFMVQPAGPQPDPTKRPSQDPPARTAIPNPTNTPLPTKTATLIPTIPPLPTDTVTPIPTNTPLPTDTPVPPTRTPIPPTDPPPTDPPPTDPPPTDTSVPVTELVAPFAVSTETPPPAVAP